MSMTNATFTFSQLLQQYFCILHHSYKTFHFLCVKNHLFVLFSGLYFSRGISHENFYSYRSHLRRREWTDCWVETRRRNKNECSLRLAIKPSRFDKAIQNSKIYLIKTNFTSMSNLHTSKMWYTWTYQFTRYLNTYYLIYL
jgi:hypothetical protein